MKTISLRRTWRQLAEYLNDKPDPTRIIQVVNRLSPRHWTFRFSFDAGGRINLILESDPALSSSDLAAVLDGFLEEVFFAERLIAYSDSCRSSVAIEALLAYPPDHNKLEFDTTDEVVQPSRLELIGYGRSRQFANSLQSGKIEKAFSEKTWHGSVKHSENPTMRVQWTVYGESRRLQFLSRLSRHLEEGERFKKDVMLFDVDGQHLGSAVAVTRPALKRTTVCTEFGEIDSQFLPANGRLPLSRQWFTEVSVPALTNDYWDRPDRGSLLRQAVQSVENALKDVEASDEFTDHLAELERLDKHRRAEELGQRKDRAKHACRLEWHGISLLTEPRCENEVIVLLAKLEGLDAIPFSQFRLVEYTTKRGIDALAHYQIMPEDVPMTFGAVELEYHFENFFHHGHPIEQANLVICWDFQDPPETDPRLRHRKDWLYQFTSQHYSFEVLVLSKIQDIERKEGAA